MIRMFRQGDILIKKVSQIPKSAIKRKNGVILEGEASNHFHRMNDGLVFDWNGAIYLEAFENATITHEEHNAISLEKGSYEVVRQREANSIGGSLKNWSYTKD